jgi:RNA polymerase-binding protein DksA
MSDSETTTTEDPSRHLSPEAVAELKAMLEDERAEILSEVTDPDSLETDLADDPGTRLSEREELETINALQSAQLEQVDQALTRIEDGSYGRCQECGVEVPFERLEALPSTPYCVECQARQVG